MPDPEPWTPYGLEAIRVRHLRRRRILAAAVLALLAILIVAVTGAGTTSRTSILSNGQEVGGGNDISIDLPTDTKPKDGPVTVSLTPGRVSLADTSQSAPASTITRADVPTFSGAPALNWNYYLVLYGPWVLLALAAFALAKRRGKHDEVNYGVYKGSLPLEMISAHARHQVITSREAKTSVFGKRREDHLPHHVLRVAQEDDA
jgi:hypothetical protein